MQLDVRLAPESHPRIASLVETILTIWGWAVFVMELGTNLTPLFSPISAIYALTLAKPVLQTTSAIAAPASSSLKQDLVFARQMMVLGLLDRWIASAVITVAKNAPPIRAHAQVLIAERGL